jgi:hypothetical protein
VCESLGASTGEGLLDEVVGFGLVRARRLLGTRSRWQRSSSVSDRLEFNHYPQPKVLEDVQREGEVSQGGRFYQPSIDQKNAGEHSLQ